MIYLDNAATSYPKPPPVTSAACEALFNYGGNPGRSGHEMSIKTGERIFQCREIISSFFNAYGAENVIFTSNATHALNTALFGTLSGHVITTAFEHNSVLRPLEELRRQGRIRYTVVSPSLTSDSITLSRIGSAIEADTRAVVVTHASNVCGRILPVRAIGELCRKHRLTFTVDASQTAGHIGINMRQLGADIICTAGHKGLLGPTGTGILLKRPEIEIAPLMFGGTGTNSSELFQPEEFPERLESGTLNVSGIISLAAGIDFINQSRRFGKEEQLIQNLYLKLRGIDKVELYSGYDTAHYVGMLSFNLRGLGSMTAANMLSDRGICVRGGLHCAPLCHKYFGTFDRGTVRVSAGYGSTTDDIDALVSAVREIAAEI